MLLHTSPIRARDRRQFAIISRALRGAAVSVHGARTAASLTRTGVLKKTQKQQLWLASKQPSVYQRDAPAALHFTIGQKCGQRLS